MFVGGGHRTKPAVRDGARKQLLRQVGRIIGHAAEVGAGKACDGIQIDWLNAGSAIEQRADFIEPRIFDEQIDIFARRQLWQVFKPAEHGMLRAIARYMLQKGADPQLVRNEPPDSGVRPRFSIAKREQPWS